jgi:RNA polymerase sigma factor (sigma-70 family)
MQRHSIDGAVRQLRDYLAAERTSGLTDGQLLHRFASMNDEAAFAGLVRRYAPMVMGVCRRLLRHEQDAEDAFQATFLVLVRRASSLNRKPSLAGYLYTVAYRAALKARTAACRYRVVSAPLQDVPAPAGMPEQECRELQGVLDSEIARLPEKYRLPLLLCDLQGKTHGEACRELGQPQGSMSRLLAKGRELLRDRLLVRGVELPAVALPVLLAHNGRAVTPLTGCLDVAFEAAAVTWGGGKETIPTRVAAIVNALLAETFWAPLKVAAALLLTIGLMGAALLTAQTRPAAEPPVAGTTVEMDGAAAEAPLPPRALARLGTSRFRHALIVCCVVWSPDGKTLVTGSHRGTIRFWDPKTGKETRVVQAHDGGVIGLAISLDGKVLATSSWDRSIRLWNMESGGQLRTLLGHGAEVCTLRFSPNGKVLASGSKDGTARLWDPTTGTLLRRIDAHRGEVRCVTFSRDGKRLATAGTDKLVRLWEAGTGKEVLTCTGHTHRVSSVAFSPDGKSLASCSWDQTVRLWDSAGKELRVLKNTGWLEDVAYSPDGKLLAVSCGWGCYVRLWDLTGKMEKPRSELRQLQALKVAFSPEGKKLAGVGWEATVRLWDVPTGKEEGAVAAPGHTGWVYALTTLAGGNVVVSAGSDGRVIVWAAPSGKLLRELKGHTDRVNCLAVLPHGKTVASGGRDKTVRLWDVAAGKEVGRFEAGGSLKSLACSPNGKLLATASGNDLFDNWVTAIPEHGAAVWDLATRKLLFRLEGHAGGVNAIAFSPDGKLIVTGGNDRTVRFWNASTGKELRTLPVQPGAVECVAFSPDGATLATAGQGGALQLWETRTGKLLRACPGESGWVLRLAFSRDGRTLVSATREGFAGIPVRLWDVRTGQERARFAGHQGTAYGATITPDGRTIVSGGGDGTILLWDVTGQVAKGKFVNTALSPVALNTAWEAVGDADGIKAHHALWSLVAAPEQSVPLLRAWLKPAVAADQKLLDRLIQELDDDTFAVREKASEELARIGEPAVAALQKAQEESPSAEVRTRAKRLLASLRGKAAQDLALRQARAVEILEQIGTPDARRFLQALAGGAADAPLTLEAKAALARLSKRKMIP